MEELQLALVAGLILLLSGGFKKAKEILDVVGDVLIRKYSKKRVVIKEHEIFSSISNHIKLIKHNEYSVNPYKQEVLTFYEKTVWTLCFENMKELSSIDVDKDSKEDFIVKVRKAFSNIASYDKILEAEGLGRKTIDAMESSVIHTKIFTNSLYERVLVDKIYDCNSERLWVILTIMHQYLTYAHPSFLDSLVKANGNLKGEEFKGIINEG